jgi:hypothetical protein
VDTNAWEEGVTMFHRKQISTLARRKFSNRLQIPRLIHTRSFASVTKHGSTHQLYPRRACNVRNEAAGTAIIYCVSGDNELCNYSSAVSDGSHCICEVACERSQQTTATRYCLEFLIHVLIMLLRDAVQNRHSYPNIDLHGDSLS